MPKSRPRPPKPKPSPRDLVANVDTSTTETTPEAGSRDTIRRFRGESVEIPTAELFARRGPDWQKVGVYVAIAIAAVAGLAHYLDMNATVKTIVEDVREVKRKLDDLFQRSIENSSRLGGLEQRIKDSETRSEQKKSHPQSPTK